MSYQLMEIDMDFELEEIFVETFAEADVDPIEVDEEQLEAEFRYILMSQM